MKAYRTLLSTYAFVLCPEGGGLDPSPKAWEALLAGCIPIIRRNASSEGHAHLPVLFVDAWTADALSEDALHSAYRDLRDRLEDRPALLEQLSLQHSSAAFRRAEPRRTRVGSRAARTARGTTARRARAAPGAAPDGQAFGVVVARCPHLSVRSRPSA
jgi:hypothetical protein